MMGTKFECGAWYTLHEVSELTGVKKGTLALWRSNGTGPDFTKIGKKIFYRGDALEEHFSNGVRRKADEARPVGSFIKTVRASQ